MVYVRKSARFVSSGSTRRTLLTVLFLALILLCFLATDARTKVIQAQSRPLRIGLMPDVNSLPYLVAEREGLFDQVGVEVELVKFQSASTRDSALQAGQIDGAVSDLLAVFFALEGGLDVVVTSVTEGRFALVVPEGSRITEPKQLVGKQIAISQNTIIEYALDKMLESIGIAPNQVRKISIPQVPLRLQMLVSGKVDAACLPDPMAAGAEATGGQTIIDSHAVQISPSVMVFRRDSLEKYRDDWQKVARAYNAAVELLNKRESSCWQDVYREMGFPRITWEVIRLPAYRPSHPPSPEHFADVWEWMYSKGLLQGQWSYDDIVDLTWLD